MKTDRRGALGAGIVAIGIAGLAPDGVARTISGQRPTVGMPRTCGLVDPLALGDMAPRFSWQVDGARQRAYRITVHAGGTGDGAAPQPIWDSGKVESSQHCDLAYAGPPLPPGGKASWQVEVWTEGTAGSILSQPARFEAGPGRWDGAWLAAETETARIDRGAGIHWLTGEGPLKADEIRAFRWTFESTDGGAAEVCLSGHEMAGAWLNGVPLQPARDLPQRWTEMVVCPATLRPGKNVLAVGVRRKVGFGVAPPLLAAVLREGAELALRRGSGSPGWKAAIAPTGPWHDPDFDDGGWAAARPASSSLPIGEPWPLYPAVRLRHAFTVARRVRSARLYATALGCYEAAINGRMIGARKLAPEFSDPAKRILYQAYDVTEALREGPNCLAFEVADGWYGGKFSTSGRFAHGPAPCRLIALLELEFEDGTRQVVATGDGWQIADSPVRETSIYDGEVFDARLDRNDWSLPEAAGTWRPARTIEGPKGVAIDPQRRPPIRVKQVLQPMAVKRLGPGHYTIDFGQNFAGWPRLSLTAPAGTRVTMRFAELLDANGGVDQANLRTAGARDVYIAAGRGREVWEPKFTYHGFRYVEIQGVPDEPSAWALEGLVGHQDLAMTGDFRSGDPVITQFWRNSVWSQKANFFGMPTDCPQRDERLGWAGDAQVFWPAASFNMDTQAFTASFADDMRASQRANGGFVDCIPPFVPGAVSTSPGWADAGIILPYTAWQQFGDTAIVARNWAAMQRYMAYIAAANPDYLWSKARGFDFGDWLAIDAPTNNPGYPTTPKDLIGTAYWARNAQMMAEMAAATGMDARPWRDLAGQIRAAFNAAFVKPDGTIGNDSQTGYVLSIQFDLLAPAARAAAGRRLAADIARRGNHLSTGFLGTPHLLDALAGAGQEAMAVTLLLQRSYPSWGYMVEQGATSMWERWNSDQGDAGMNSRNHYAFGAIGAFLFRRIAGIAPLAPGFAKVAVAPLLDARLKSAGATYRSVNGTIRTDWQAGDGRYTLEVEVPHGVDAEVHLPVGQGKTRRVAAKAGLNRYQGKLPGPVTS